ncbi:competence/damage-inducible protein A [Clostridium sp. Marseille-Q7071]
MIAEILCVGTELLLGDIVNTNAQYLARRLSELGVFVYHQSVIGDNPERLKDAYKLAFSRSDLVITTGGLGPTKDDLTKEVAFEYFGKESVLHNESLEIIEGYFNKLGKPMSESNKKQAYFPKDAIILPNNNGTAPGCIIDEEGKILITLPGPPKEMKPMFEEAAVPYLLKYQDGILVSKVLRVIGVGESEAADMLTDIIDNQTNPTVAPYAKDGEVTFRITAKSHSEEESYELIKPIEEKVRKILGDRIYGEGETSLEEVLAEMLVKNNLTIATAESCTGGMIAAKLVNHSGVSSSFLEGAVTYSNESKIRRLGVNKNTLENYGAVSSETAEEMVKGITKTSGADIGISTTGIAGPSGGTEEKPVGLVYIGLSIKDEIIIKKLNLAGNRQKIRERATNIALDLLRRELLKRGIR